MFKFARRKAQVQVQSFLRRLLDRTAPNLPLWGEESRGEGRSNRTVPVLLVPLEDGKLQTDHVVFALTKDVSSRGLALTLPQPLRLGEVVIAVSSEGGVEYVRGTVRQNAPMGGGFWQLGIELRSRVVAEDWPQVKELARFAARLRPKSRGE